MIRVVSIASMTVGGLIYILWRPDSLTMFSWLSALGLDRPVGFMRALAATYFGILPGWVYLSLPQALWVLSGCLGVHSIWRDIRRREEQSWMTAVLLVALGAELGQAIGFIEGVYDSVDLALVLVAFCAAQATALATTERVGNERVCT